MNAEASGTVKSGGSTAGPLDEAADAAYKAVQSFVSTTLELRDAPAVDAGNALYKVAASIDYLAFAARQLRASQEEYEDSEEVAIDYCVDRASEAGRYAREAAASMHRRAGL
jgi:hypothetical protein